MWSSYAKPEGPVSGAARFNVLEKEPSEVGGRCGGLLAAKEPSISPGAGDIPQKAPRRLKQATESR